MVDWYYLLAAASLGFHLGVFLKEREHAKEEAAAFDRRMAALREQAKESGK